MLSVMIITKNEAYHLERCLQSVAFASEVIVLDSGSTDTTVAIAKRFTSQVYAADWQGYGIQKQRALALTRHPWVLSIDADELVDATLQAAILEAIASNKADAYRIPIRLQFQGHSLRYSGSPTRHVRLFKRAGASFTLDVVHEKVKLPQHARITQLSAPLWHHCFRDVSHMLDKLNRYSSYSAQIRLENKQSSSILKACLKSGWTFIRCYAFQLGCLEGRLGLLFAVYHAQASFYRAVKQCYPDRKGGAL